MKKISTLIALVCIVISIQSCKKEKDTNPVPTPPKKECRITAITVGGNTSSFSYNNDKKVSQIITSGTPEETKTFTYNGNTINIITKSGTTVDGKSVLTTNDEGKISRLEQRDLITDTVTYSTNFEYSSNGELLKATHNSGSASPNIVNYAYSNGNLMSFSNSGDVTTYEYYPNQDFRIGDYNYIAQALQFGNAFFIVNKNLVKSADNGSDITNYNYTFDEDNNITKVEIVKGSNILT